MLAFYRDTLGLPLEGELEMPNGTHMTRLLCGKTVIKLLVHKREPKAEAAPGGINGATGYRYWTITVGDKNANNAAWSYPDPSPGFEEQADYIAFYAHSVDAAYVDDELVGAPDWKWLGGWVTEDIAGPFITRERAAAEH